MLRVADKIEVGDPDAHEKLVAPHPWIIHSTRHASAGWSTGYAPRSCFVNGIVPL